MDSSNVQRVRVGYRCRAATSPSRREHSADRGHPVDPVLSRIRRFYPAATLLLRCECTMPSCTPCIRAQCSRAHASVVRCLATMRARTPRTASPLKPSTKNRTATMNTSRPRFVASFASSWRWSSSLPHQAAYGLPCWDRSPLLGYPEARRLRRYLLPAEIGGLGESPEPCRYVLRRPRGSPRPSWRLAWMSMPNVPAAAFARSRRSGYR